MTVTLPPHGVNPADEQTASTVSTAPLGPSTAQGPRLREQEHAAATPDQVDEEEKENAQGESAVRSPRFSTRRLSTPGDPPAPEASAPLPPPPPASPHIRPLGTPLSPRRERRRMADEVRNALVRMVIMIACTLLGGMVVTAARFADSWFSAPSLLITLVLVVATVWSVLDVFVARQIHAEHVARGERCPFDP